MAEYYLGYVIENPEAIDEQELENLLRDRFGNVSRVYGRPSFRITSDIEDGDIMGEELNNLLQDRGGLTFQVCYYDDERMRRYIDMCTKGRDMIDRMDRLG